MAALLPIRWHGHQVDVCAVLDDQQIRWNARDVLVAATGEAGDFEDEPSHAAFRYSQHLTASAYPYATIRNLIGDTETGQELLTFLAAREDGIATMGYGIVARYATTSSRYDGPLYPIARAAQLLDQDPAIEVGERRLFQWLLDADWIRRQGNEYRPGELAIVAGRLAVVPRRLPHTGDAYPQVVLTDRGLTELHAALGGTDPTVLEQEHA